MSKTLAPLSAARVAAVKPARPAPTTSTSKFIGSIVVYAHLDLDFKRSVMILRSQRMKKTAFSVSVSLIGGHSRVLLAGTQANLDWTPD
jgi:hypothetical protein